MNEAPNQGAEGIDAARIEERKRIVAELEQGQVNYDALAAEVSRLREERALAGQMLNDRDAEIGRLAKELEECHGQPGSSDPAKIGHAGLISLLRIQRDKEREKHAMTKLDRSKYHKWWSERCEQLAAAQSALAEKEKELASATQCVSDFHETLKVVRTELCTERAARAIAQAGLSAECAIHRKQYDGIQSQLQQAERERDAAKYAHAIVCYNLGDTQVRCDSLRAELAATQETVRRVERERDTLSASYNSVFDERDALQKQNSELLADVERWKNFNDHPAFVEKIARLEARNAELVKVLDALIPDKNQQQSLLAALNQSPE